MNNFIKSLGNRNLMFPLNLAGTQLISTLYSENGHSARNSKKFRTYIDCLKFDFYSREALIDFEKLRSPKFGALEESLKDPVRL